MRLQQADVQIYIRSHFFCDLERIFCISFAGNFDPFLFEYRWSVFDGYQCTSVGCCGDNSHSCFSYLIGIFVQWESKHFNTTGVRFTWTSPPFGPVYVDSTSGGMSAFFVFHIDQITSPIGIIDAEFERSLSIVGLQTPAGYRSDGSSVYIGTERFFIVFPPPAPTDTVDFIFQIWTAHRLSFRIHCHNVKYMIFVRFYVFAFWLIQVNAHIRCERRERNALGIDTGISSRFEYTGGERCV